MPLIPQHIKELMQFEFKAPPQYTYKQYILIRTDKEFSLGKIIAHACHASSSALLWEFQTKKGVWEHHPRIMKWFNSGKCQAKIILKAKDVDELWYYIHQAIFESPDIPIAIIPDGGAHEVEPNTIIACAIGPVTPREAKKIGLRDLKLYK